MQITWKTTLKSFEDRRYKIGINNNSAKKESLSQVRVKWKRMTGNNLEHV